MIISERIFDRLVEIKMSQSEFSRQTGISTSTINDWKRKKTNPSADKLVCICKVLEMSLADLLCEEEDRDAFEVDYIPGEKQLIEVISKSDILMQRRIISHFEKILWNTNEGLGEKNKRKVSVIQDVDGNSIVVINDIIFKGKRSIDWKDVRKYLQQYVGEFYTIASTKDIVYIGSDLPSEFTGSKYTNKLNGAVAKAKANASQGIPELIEIAVGKHFRENVGEKHKWNAKYGWYRYDSRFALPVYGEDGNIDRYNIFHVSLIIRHANDGKLYLYDIIDIKKETSNPLES